MDFASGVSSRICIGCDHFCIGCDGSASTVKLDRRLALPALQETDKGVMNTGGFRERLLRESLPSAVLSHHASERRGELRWNGHHSIYCVSLISTCHRL